MSQSNSSAVNVQEGKWEKFDDAQFKKHPFPSESLVDKITLSTGGVMPALSTSQNNDKPAASAIPSPNPSVHHAPFYKYFKAAAAKSYRVEGIQGNLKYVPPSNNEQVGKLYQLHGINHHLFKPGCAVYKEILQSVQTYDPESSSQVNSWTLQVVQSLFRWEPSSSGSDVGADPEIQSTEKWFPLKEVSSLVTLVNAEGSVGQGNLDLTDFDKNKGHEKIWNVMDGQHRGSALCQVLASGRSHPAAIKDLVVNVVVYSLKDDVDLLQNNFESIMGTVTRNSASIRDVNHNLTGTSHESILLNLIHSSFRLDVPSTKKKKKDVPSTKKKKKKNPQQAQVEPLSVFFTELRGQVVKQLESFTNLDCPPGGKTDHSISVFANKKFTQSYFSPSCKVPEFRKDYVTEPHNPSSVRLSDHLITIGRAISANFGMKEKVASNLKELDGYLNECKLGKIHLNIKNQSIPSTFSIGSPIFSLHRIDR